MAEVVGVSNLVSDLLALSDDVTEDKRTHRAAGQVVLKPARGEARKKSGKLRKSGRKGATKTEGTVLFGNKKVVYAAAHHFGHKRRPQGGFVKPDPWLYEAADDNIEGVIKVYSDRLEQVSRRF